ncbi:uncharacterized protein RCC_08066 [Ramularia collo-cygni]|uniref:Uncharacterized protein n=1 Tax=Ramularia collo-cygni TaxID=112498 RepID=A0A2D3VBL0_9PEZI|nr:uncharacterized protein RCC_08066 [Ramularia collo-cygni]CZT22197.1 uncharacterized protein RCC_08066 [Ramularia collo-cygni]
MPHLRVDRASRIEPPSPSPSSTLQNGHPIYSLRRLHIITAAFGNLLFLFCFDHYPFVRITIYFLFGSIFFTMCDLLAYAKAPSPQTHCQKKWILLGDIVWAAILQLGFWGSVVDLQWGGPSGAYYGSCYYRWCLFIASSRGIL